MRHKNGGIKPIRWENGRLYLLDQRLLPSAVKWLAYDNVKDVAKAITEMVVRGAPAIGITAAFGVVLAAKSQISNKPKTWRAAIQSDLVLLKAARPTAVNLAWAVDKMALIIGRQDTDITHLEQLAQAIHREDIEANQLMGDLGAKYIQQGQSVLTHCNAGALATGGYGTALGVIRSAYHQDKIKRVFADETRPWLQGARLTAWELIEDGIPVTLVAEGAAAHVMSQGKIDWLIVGSDRIAANGDVANKIGTYSAAICARHHGLKVMVVAPTSTVDMQAETGGDIPIEERPADELLCLSGKKIAAAEATAVNPVFDITPASLVDVIVTEKGTVELPNHEKMAKLMDT